jgi:transposase InsO family protein
MATLGSVLGLAFFNDKAHLSAHCRGCLLGKMSRNSFRSTRTRGTHIGDIVHSDVCGPFQICTPSGARFFANFKDDFSNFCEIHLLKHKSEVPEAFKKFNAKMKTETGQETKILRTDGGGEFCSKEFEDWLGKAGIAHQVTPPYTPQLNGVAERVNRTVVESARSQMYGKKVPLELWGLAVLCAVYVQNRVISSTGKVTPFQLWYGKEPDVSHLRTFGSTAFAHVPDEKRRKLDPKATEGIMVGYGDSYRVYKIWDPVDRKIITSRDVVFDEKCSFDHSSELEEMDYFSLFPIPTDDPLVNYFFFVISLGMPITNSLIIFSILANTYSGADPLEPT